MRIAVLGAGSIGCLIAAKLVMDGHDILVMLEENTVQLWQFVPQKLLVMGC